MTDERMQYYAENMERLVKRDRLFLNNPVIMQGLGLAPLIVAATNLRSALVLAVAVILLLTPTRMLAAFLGRFSYFRFRGLTYTLTAAIVYMGVWWAVRWIFPAAQISAVGLYLPLLVTEPIILKRYERPQRERISTAFRKGLLTTGGFVLVVLLVAVLRELLGAGTLYGNLVLANPPLPLAALPSGGFILLALIMAIWRGLVKSFRKNITIGARTQT